MKLKKTIMMATLVAGGLLAGIPLQAQDAPKTPPAGDQPAAAAPAPRRPQFTLDGMAKALDLTDDQKTKVKPIMEEQQKKMTDLRNDKTLSPEDRRAKMKEIRDATGAKLKEVLTAEQYAKWEKMGPPNRRPAAPAAAPATPPADDKAKN
jgi:protein CpxP